ncbi:unnamed protein product, partial [Ilex paraguariensis]
MKRITQPSLVHMPPLLREASNFEVESSSNIEVDDIVVEVSTSEDEIESVEDLQDACNQLYEECLKHKKKLLSLSTRLKSSEDDKKALHVDLVNFKAHIYGLDEEKSLQEKVRFLESEHRGLEESKKCLEYKLIKLDRELPNRKNFQRDFPS